VSQVVNHPGVEISSLSGYLSDGKLIQFFRFQSNPKQLEETPVYYLNGEGGELLIGLLQASPTKDLGYPQELVYNGKPIVIDELLGIGGSSVVYKSTISDQEVVVKCFRSEGMRKLEKEVERLREVADLPNVTKLVDVLKESNALILSPVGIPFCATPNPTRPTSLAFAEDFKRLLNVLENVHKKGLVHRDITMQNWFKLRDSNEILLNDWGCAAKQGEQTVYSGNLAFCPNHILDLLRTQGGKHSILLHQVMIWR